MLLSPAHISVRLKIYVSLYSSNASPAFCLSLLSAVYRWLYYNYFTAAALFGGLLCAFSSGSIIPCATVLSVLSTIFKIVG